VSSASGSSRLIERKSPAEVDSMRRGGAMLARILNRVARQVAPGVTTRDLDRMAREWIFEAGARPAFLGYENYPNTLCTSINEQVVHGIPSRRELVEGDIVSIDCGLFRDGFFSDMAITVPVGVVSREALDLIETTRRSLELAIEVSRPNNRIGDIGAAVQEHAEARGYGVVQDYTGHGIGRRLHEPPKIPNIGKRGVGARLLTGMVLAIEPMVNIGTWETEVLEDDWTVVTADGSLSCHFEHTLAITDSGPLVLTRED
jgi:methionyl aminopeptidase